MQNNRAAAAQVAKYMLAFESEVPHLPAAAAAFYCCCCAHSLPRRCGMQDELEEYIGEVLSDAASEDDIAWLVSCLQVAPLPQPPPPGSAHVFSSLP